MCECGCGNITRIAPRTNTRDGWIKGKPQRFINGHNVNSAILIKYNKENGAWNKGKTFEDDNRVPRPWLGKKRHLPLRIKDRTLLKKNEKKHLDTEYRIWAGAIKKRDEWICRIKDNNCRGRLEAHHILSWREYPELRYKINNGITLCRAHHPIKRAEEKRLVPYFMGLVPELKV